MRAHQRFELGAPRAVADDVELQRRENRRRAGAAAAISVSWLFSGRRLATVMTELTGRVAASGLRSG